MIDEFERFETIGIREKVCNPEFTALLWLLIKELGKKEKLDYLQVFEIKDITKDEIVVEHRQEVPEYSSVAKFPIAKTTLQYEKFFENVHPGLKIFVVDQGDAQIMMLAEEY